ncbi:MAG: glycosyltransferase family 2 protein, partial [Nitrospinae bacterium]|nr:glycosyltransferase family 2 protein [Nitrospinota bacterium]
AFRPPFTFFKMYLLRKGFLEGSFGLTLSGLYAIYTYVKYAKLREMNQR